MSRLKRKKVKPFARLTFNDTLQINGFKLLAERKGPLKQYVGQTFVIRFNDPLSLAKSYSARLSATWAAVWSLGGEFGNHWRRAKKGN